MVLLRMVGAGRGLLLGLDGDRAVESGWFRIVGVGLPAEWACWDMSSSVRVYWASGCLYWGKVTV